MKENFAVETAKIVGASSQSSWAQTHSYFPDDLLKKEKRGNLFAVLLLRGLGEGVEAIASGREILGRLHEEYYGNLEGSAFLRLSESVEKVCNEGQNIEICSAVLLGNVLYLAIYGNGKIFLKRKEKSGYLLIGRGGLKTASGIIEENDLAILGSEVFFETVGKKIDEISLNSIDLDEAVEPLTSEILGKENVPETAAIFLLFNKTAESFLVENASEENTSLPEETALKEEVSEKKLGFGLFSKKKIVVKRENFNSRKKIYFIISLILLAVLAACFVLGAKKNFQNKKYLEAEKLVLQSEEKFTQGKSVFVNEPVQGRELVKEAKNLTEKALTVQNNFEKASLLAKQIDEFLESSVFEISFSELPVFMDLNLVEDGAEGVSLALLDKNLLILDTIKKKIYLLDYEKKSNKILNYLSENGKLLLGLKDQVIVFTPEKIEKVGLSKESSTVVIENNDWKNISAISVFNENLYLLDEGEGVVWRYLKTNNGYSTKKNWFIETPPDLTGSVSMAIDGSVWILQQKRILKFNLGKQENFSLAKLPEEFENPTKIYTSEEEDSLFVMDKERGKIYQIAKTGEFKISYSWEGIKQSSDFVAIESAKKIFVLSGSKIYEMGMK